MSALIPRDLRQRRDAIVLRAEPLDATRRMAALNTELLQHTSRWQMVAALNKQVQRGEIRVLRGPTWNFEAGFWEARIVRLRPAAPRWRKPALIAAPIVALLGAAWWVLASLTMPAVVALCGAAIVALFGVVKLHRTIIVEQHQKVTIR